VAPQGIIARHAQNGIAQPGREANTVREMVRLGHVWIGRSILEPVATEFAPVNTQSHVTSQEPNGDCAVAA
jgi:hypothetical protein